MATLVSGTIQLPDNTGHFAGASVYIYLERAGMMDMPAQVVTHTVQHNVTYEGAILPFSVEGQLEDAEGKFNLRVHISMHNSDDVKKGDFVTKRACTVLKNGAPDTVDVSVEAV